MTNVLFKHHYREDSRLPRLGHILVATDTSPGLYTIIVDFITVEVDNAKHRYGTRL